MGRNMDDQIETVIRSLSECWPVLCLIAACALLIGFVIGVRLKKRGAFRVSMETFILLLSGIFLVGAVVCQTVGVMETFSSVVATIFTSVVFSWLLTKVSGKEEWQEREQELALRSYRHVDYIESASKTAEQTIKQYIEGEKGDAITLEEKLVLSRAMDYIGYIRGGIRTCKMDWFDLMSQEDQSNVASEEIPELDVSAMDMSQEDA